MSSFIPPKGGPPKLGPGGLTEEEIKKLDETFKEKNGGKPQGPPPSIRPDDVLPYGLPNVNQIIEYETGRATVPEETQALRTARSQRQEAINEAQRLEQQRQEAIKQAQQIEEIIRQVGDDVYLQGSGEKYFTIDGKPVTRDTLRQLREQADSLYDFAERSYTLQGDLEKYSGTVVGDIYSQIKLIQTENRRVYEAQRKIERAMREVDRYNTGLATSMEALNDTIYPRAATRLIPGPAAGPASGSIGEQIQQRLTPVTAGILRSEAFISKPIMDITREGRKLEEKGRSGLMTMGLIEATPETSAKARKYTSLILSGSLLQFGGSILDTVTLPLRPVRQAQVISETQSLLTSPKKQRQFKEQIEATPTGFVSSLIGASVGGKIFGGILDSVFPVKKKITYEPVSYRGSKQLPLKTGKIQRTISSTKETSIFTRKIVQPMRFQPTTIAQKVRSSRIRFVGVITPEKVNIVDEPLGFDLNDYLMPKGKYPKSGSGGFGKKTYRQTGGELIETFEPSLKTVEKTVYRYRYVPLKPRGEFFDTILKETKIKTRVTTEPYLGILDQTIQFKVPLASEKLITTIVPTQGQEYALLSSLGLSQTLDKPSKIGDKSKLIETVTPSNIQKDVQIPLIKSEIEPVESMSLDLNIVPMEKQDYKQSHKNGSILDIIYKEKEVSEPPLPPSLFFEKTEEEEEYNLDFMLFGEEKKGKKRVKRGESAEERRYPALKPKEFLRSII